MSAKYVGLNSILGNVEVGKNVTIMHNCIIEDGVKLGDNCYIDSNCIIRAGSTIGNNATISSNCIIGEYTNEFFSEHINSGYTLSIGDNALIRSGSIIYSDSIIGNNFQTGHQVTIREKTIIGNNVSIGTLSDIQGHCSIGNYVRLHSNVHVGQFTKIDGYNWIFPYVIITNDPTPPSEKLYGVHVCPFAIIAAGSVILPGIEIGKESLVGAGATVTKNVSEYAVVVGNPAKQISDVREIKRKDTGESAYPWKFHFSREMPWDEFGGYENWFNSLSDDEKKQLV